MKQARNIRFTHPAIFRAAFAGLAALVLGLCPLPASAQALGTACATAGEGLFGPYNGGIIVCSGGIWRTSYIFDTGQGNILIATTSTGTPSGSFNTALGVNALMNPSGTQNTGIGYSAGSAITTGNYNTALGSGALQSNTTAVSNTAVGYLALSTVTTASANTAVGSSALAATTGGSNTAVGQSAGANITTGSNNIAIGFNAQVPTATANNQVRIGDANITVISGQVAWTFPSDRRIKKDIQDSDLGLDFIQKLRPISYRLKNGNERLDYGFIAQDVEKALGGRTTNMVTQMGDEMKTYQLRHNDLIAPLVKAVQQQQQIIEKQQESIQKQAAALAKLTAYVNAHITAAGFINQP